MAGQALSREDVRRARRREGESTGDRVRRLRRLIGGCTLTDLASAGGHPPDRLTVGDVRTRRELLTVTPTDPVCQALRRMATIDVGRLPVVAADDHQRLVGLIRRSNLGTAYRQAVTTSLASQQRTELRRLRDLAGTNFLEVRVTSDGEAAGRPVRAVDWPRHTLLTTVHRAGDLIMPDGETEPRPGDMVSVIVDDEHVGAVRLLLTGSDEPASGEAG